jgi:aminopeptidase N
MHGMLEAVAGEPDELIAQHLLGRIQTVYWRFLDRTSRSTMAGALEDTLWRGLARAREPSRKGAWWAALVSVTTTPRGIARLERIWQTRRPPPGLQLAEPQYTALAEALALREPARAHQILDGEERRITNPDRAERFRFVRPSLSPDPAVRDSVFDSFRAVDNRRRESWVLDAMSYLNHPLRAEHAERYLEPGLGLVEDIQRTGDIFFPLNWLNSLLDGHQSVRAAETVAAFLTRRADLPPRLRGKTLQAADELFRAARIANGWEPPAGLMLEP